MKHNLDLSHKELATLKVIRNHVSHKGEFPSVRTVTTQLGYKSTYSVMVLFDKLIEQGFISKANGKYQLLKDVSASVQNARTVLVPLVGTAACGAPLLAEQNIEAMIPVSVQMATPGFKYFLLHAAGNSMNKKGISDGDFVLARQQNTAESGDVVVALIDDEATIKQIEFSRDAILLKPQSTESKHTPIILTQDFQIQGKVITSIPRTQLK